MSTNESRIVADMNQMPGDARAREASAAAVPTTQASIVPADSIAGRALVAVIAIMTFLAALTLGAVVLVRAAASEWQSAVAREVTIQIRPIQGRDVEADVRRAADIAAAIPGIAGVRPYTKVESARLLEPWLGAGLALDDLPVPRLIVVRIDGAPDLVALRKALSERVPGASLDDHRGWVDRMRTMAGTAVAGGIAVLLLVLAATMLSVTFATRGAMATNRPIIEVLHFVGAKDSFIAGQFQRHFLLLGLKGGAIGGIAAMALFALASLIGDWFTATASQDQVAALFGSFAIGIAGYGAVGGLIVLIGVVTAGTSRFTVYRTLRLME
jgi:cell division transport system permease protein